MKPGITVITLGVKDFKRSLNFYKNGLGWPTKATETDSIAFFELNGTRLALYPKDDLAKDANIPAGGSGFSGITLSHNVSSESEVDSLIVDLRRIGAKIVVEPHRTSWGGYGAYFSDPDGYLWEVVYNPGWKIDKDGLVKFP